MLHEIIIPLLGGVTIGLSALLLMLFKGRIAGISGMFKGLIWEQGYERYWRMMFILGIIVSSLFIKLIFPSQLIAREGFSLVILAVSGLLVGIGTYLSNGCTSGHGVCGTARLSVRSIAATVTFITFGALAVFIVNQVASL
ncbi:YeeE/YedE thiosulfate transporter family protein [Marinicella sp. S1101]|uniref:YeeE/YedE family protein n=1 Tax=Marinicella marina TaxID=2996016 RepID=UPI00226087A7|nr:YeeE/YedE thiosulfate transporter family protein [Marinicella marina]MCX7554191.1 YeeE/YedE thiosulfate transporter family protein [Marinicella marina]MDJ1141116.1 YeeE/YedE thiosulfate transporter family protein [Marinicella marina]